jgi:murein DD-endopeptidase MepM/ murein hydrolase activator NlpD
MPGTVRFAGAVVGERWITVTHADGLETTYGGVTPTVEAGQRVMLGQPIGRVRAGRRHLDWGARLHGAYIDPLGLLTGWRVRLVAPSEGPVAQ